MRWLLLLALFSASAAHGDCGVTPPALNIVAQAPQLVKSYTRFQDYVIRVFDSCDHTKGLSEIEISKGGRVVYSTMGYSFALGYSLAQDQPPDSVKPRPGDDFTGEGVAELLISEWSGGAHCCYTFHLFRLGPQFSHIQDIPLLDADESAFVRRPGVKGLVLASFDFSAFAYFPKGFANSPAGRVFLSYQDDKFRPDAKLMKSNAPTDAEVARCAGLFKPSRDWKDGQPSGLWYLATDLIYTGNANAAWTFLDAAWGGSAADKKKYLEDYRQRFKKSAYYPDLLHLQQAPVSSAGQKIDWTKQCFAYMHG